MEPLIFDTHAHYTSGAFNKDRGELLAALPEEGVALVLDCGTDLETSRESLALAKQYPHVYAAAGIHPQSLIEEDGSTLRVFKGDWRAEMKEMEALYQEDKVVAVGEVGLDHHWPVPKDEQLLLFEAEIRFAMERDLPLSIHDREAHEDMYRLLKQYKPKGVLHSYSGSAEDAKWLCAQGMYLGFTGVLTFKNARRPLEVTQMIPEEYLLLETDCPYLTPEPYRGKRNNSSLIRYTAEKIAEVRGKQPEEILRLALENGKRLYRV